MIKKPQLASCENREKLPRTNSFCGNPEDWFVTSILGHFNLRALTFDFFVDWSKSPITLTKEFWLKGISESSINTNFNLADIPQELNNAYGESFVETYTKFCENYSIIPYAIIFDDSNNWSDEKSNLLLVRFSSGSNNKIEYETTIISINELKEKIQNNSGGSISIGSKGLYYGTSRLECFLSTSNSLYPGDADLLLVDDEGRAKCIIEFKKHNLSSDISYQKISNYYPKPDGRKYDRLEVLRDYLSKEENIPLIIIYYPTNTKEKYGVIEVIHGCTGALKKMGSRKFDLPSIDSINQIKQTIEVVLKGIEYYKKNIT
ncbi:hypothetical protein SAMN05216474_2139 [Lishizhenia tianjinensis]|uniref:PD-(D/E)XK nuclease superfamily protein n=1 Tax=Lishizhenia tianjinensis TaxID=477690 RepID=A0A1I7AJ87_9FLAO|nr:hypothetical protein [Lishizhenia tianjinensis]SFT74905.1 hypothetical protein SAMN05216474_2139 [Lishizhenia tianjinensis]